MIGKEIIVSNSIKKVNLESLFSMINIFSNISRDVPKVRALGWENTRKSPRFKFRYGDDREAWVSWKMFYERNFKPSPIWLDRSP